MSKLCLLAEWSFLPEKESDQRRLSCISDPIPVGDGSGYILAIELWWEAGDAINEILLLWAQRFLPRKLIRLGIPAQLAATPALVARPLFDPYSSDCVKSESLIEF